jgi:hypothetical protein
MMLLYCLIMSFVTLKGMMAPYMYVYHLCTATAATASQKALSGSVGFLRCLVSIYRGISFPFFCTSGRNRMRDSVSGLYSRGPSRPLNVEGYGLSKFSAALTAAAAESAAGTALDATRIDCEAESGRGLLEPAEALPLLVPPAPPLPPPGVRMDWEGSPAPSFLGFDAPLLAPFDCTGNRHRGVTAPHCCSTLRLERCVEADATERVNEVLEPTEAASPPAPPSALPLGPSDP